MNDKEVLKILLEKLTGIEVKQNQMVEDVVDLKNKQNQIAEDVVDLKIKQNVIMEQTAFLTEFKTENIEKLVDIEKRVQQNTTDISLLKRVIATN